jgi:hypothetical protein
MCWQCAGRPTASPPYLVPALHAMILPVSLILCSSAACCVPALPLCPAPAGGGCPNVPGKWYSDR